MLIYEALHSSLSNAPLIVASLGQCVLIKPSIVLNI
jgi:hypothetical protein